MVILMFWYLNTLDVLTTLLGFKLGHAEASPFIRLLLNSTPPLEALLLTKMVAVVIAGTAVALGKYGAVRGMNYVCAAVVAWNLLAMLVS